MKPDVLAYACWIDDFPHMRNIIWSASRERARMVAFESLAAARNCKIRDAMRMMRFRRAPEYDWRASVEFQDRPRGECLVLLDIAEAEEMDDE